MFTIIIDEEFECEDDMAIALRMIARMIEDGYNEGYQPSWRVDEVVEDKDQ